MTRPEKRGEPTSGGTADRPHAIVIGGGFAGAAAASALAEAGASVTLVEERHMLGGRTSSLKDGVTRQEVDNGQHLFLGAYRDTRAFLKRLGVEDRVRFERPFAISFADRGGRVSCLRAFALPGLVGLALGLLRFQEPRLRDKVSLLYGLWRSGGRSGRPNPDWVVSRWLSHLRQTLGARRAFWEPLCYAALNERPDLASAQALEAVLKDGLLQDDAGRALGYATLPLGRLWAVELAEYLKRRDGRVAPGQKAVGFRVSEGRATAVDIEGAGPVPADAFILAAPLAQSIALAPEPLRPAISGLADHDHAPILAVNLWFSRAPFEASFVGLLDADVQWFFNRERLWGPGAAGQVSAVLSAARGHAKRTADELIAIAMADLRRAFPSHREDPRHASVHWERRATPSPTPAFWRSRPKVETAISNLFFAGDWTDVGLPPTIEAACRSGHRAAALALAQLKLAPRS